MADREFIVDIILKARDETARAFAAATGQLEAYDALLDEQKVKSKAVAAAQKDLSQELEHGVSTLDRYKSALKDVDQEWSKNDAANRRALNSYQGLEQATRRYVKAQADGKIGSAEYAKILSDLVKAQEGYSRSLKSVTDLSIESRRERAQQAQQEIEYQSRLETAGRIEATAAKAAEQRANAIDRVVASTHRHAEVLARTNVSQTEEIRATRELTAARDTLVQKGLSLTEAESRIHEVRQRSLRDHGFESKAARDTARVLEDQAKAYRLVEDAVHRVESVRAATERAEKTRGRGGTPSPVRPLDPATRALGSVDLHGTGGGAGGPSGGQQQPGGFAPIISVLNQAKQAFASLDTTTSGFTGHLKGALGFTAVLLIQPLIALIGGVVAAFASLASAAIAAGAAIGTVFLSGVAQAIPVLGVMAAAMQRLQGVFGLVQAGLQQQQQRFIAQYETAYQLKLGIDQVAIAQHNLSNALYAAHQAVINVGFAEHARTDALYSLQQAVRNVGVAELNLNTTRQQARRQLQDLIFQETQARLAAEASTLAITHSQRALAQAVVTGGDVQSAQLQLAQAQAQHAQAVSTAQRAIQDAAPGSLARQNIQEQVVQGTVAVQQAQHAVTDAEFGLRQAIIAVAQAQRAVVDARFQVAQARAQIVEAQQAAQGFNLGTAAQLAWLRSQMSKTEISLADSITRILGLFRGANAYMRPITDAIIGAFVPLSNRIYQLLKDPRIFGALKGLADAIGGTIRTATRDLTDNSAINGFISLIKAATQNIGPFAHLIVDMIRAAGSIAVTAAPFVHQFLGFLVGLADQFSKWAQSTQGKNWLKDFFDVAFRSLEAFIKLAVSIGRLVLDIVGIGGGAQSGINILKVLQGWVDRTASSIEHHGKVFKELHQLWSIAVPTVRILGEVLGAVGHAFLQLSTSQQGQSAFKSLADLVVKVLIPAFVRFTTEIGFVVTHVLHFLDQHPKLQKFLVDLIATVAVLAVGGKALGLIFGPLAAIVNLIIKFSGLISAIKTIIALAPEIGTALAEAFTSSLGVALLVVAAIVAIAAVTGNLGNLVKAVTTPFINLWNQIKQPLEDLQKKFLYFINGVLAPFGVHVKNLGQIFHAVFAGILAVVRDVFGGIGTLIGRILGDAFRQIGDIFQILGDLVRGHFGAVVKDFKKLGLDILRGLWDGLKAIPELIIGLFVKLVNSILHFLGISSPSKKFHNIGQDMVNGLWNGLKSIAEFAEKILGWIASGIGKVISWVLGLGVSILKALWNGIVNAAKQYFNFSNWLWKTIFNAVFGLLKDVEKLGEKIIDAIIKGIKKAPGKIANAVKSLIPKPLRDAANTIGGALPWNWNQGGAVPGYGGGDIVASRLEPGEHVFTKEEVAAAGGHGTLFAFRAMLGGGGQGGPGGYAQGGAVSSTIFAQNILGPGRVTQGVTGQLGAQLYNIQQFALKFEQDWLNMWNAVNKASSDNIASIEKQFSDSFSKIQTGWRNFYDNLKKILDNDWPLINQRVQQGLSTMTGNFDTAYKKADKDSYSAFWYIMHAANQALKGFGAKPVDVKLGDQPRFASGGFFGMMGERGSDMVHAVLGRGEAVLNYAQQSFVEPAMRAYYGFGLDKLFSKVRGEHAGDSEGFYGGKARPNKFAAGGYVFPFPKNQSFTWARVDQGQDLQTTPGGAVLAIAPGIVRPASDRFSGFGGHYAEQSVTAGPLAGRGLYYGHIWANKFGQVNAGDIIGRTQTSADQWTAAPAGWLELGFLPYGSMSAGNAIAPILHALAAGHQVTGAGGLGAIPAAAVWNAIQKQKVVGSGVLAQLLKATIGKVTDAANAFGQNAAGSAGGGAGAIGAGWSGPWVSVMAQIAKKFRWNLPDWRWLVNAESSGNPAAVNPGSGAFGLGQFLGATARAYAKFGALSRNPVQQIEAMAQYILDRYRNPTVAKAFHLANNWYAKGGFVDGAVPIIGHVGEWVLNKAQQAKLGGWLGAAPHKIANALGLTGGKTEYATGGVIGGNAPRLSLTPTLGAAGQIPDATTLVGTGSLQFLDTSISLVERAQRLILHLESSLNRSTKKFADDFTRYLNNLQALIGDGGLLDSANAALDTATNESNAIVSLAANGLIRLGKGVNNAKNWVRIVSQNLQRSATGQTALAVATTELQTTRALGDNIRNLRALEETALNNVNKQIRDFGRVTSKNVAQYRQLLAARNNLVGRIIDTDSKLAQNAQDIVDKQQTRFQAQLEQTLRGTATLGGKAVGSITEGIRPGTAGNLQNTFNNLQGILAKVGPNIALGLAQMAQTIAQTLGDPNKLRISDQAVVDASEKQREALQQAYNNAAAKAQKDPRWQKVADDLLTQLESATTAVVQAQAQALSDAMQAQDTKSQMQTAILDIRNRFAQVVIGFGDNLGGIGQQIGISRDRTSALQGQIGAYQGLLATAQSQGNVQAANDLTQKIQDLTAQVAEANLQTQQLITAYRQVSVTILSATSQARGGFISSASSIFQTLGQITGSLNLPERIATLRSAATDLVTEGVNAVKNITDTINDPNGPFGANQGQANTFLSGATSAFGQGPAAFATWLAKNAGALSGFEAQLPPEEQQLFQGLIGALIDNTTASVSNTSELQQLNATTNQQQFTSSAWTMFREAIFNGLGQLLPQYAMQVPSLDVGGTLMSSGLVYGHVGETITPANVIRGNIGGTTHQTNHFNIDHPVEVADPVLFGNAVAWRLSHDPNSR